jgi:hypothetical protein
MGALTNTAILHEILRGDGLHYATDDRVNPNGSPDLTSLGFSDQEGLPWNLMILSYPDAALLRFYSYIGPPSYAAPREKILNLINQINWSYLFESHFDLAPNSQNMRFKCSFRGVGVGLPAYEAREAIQAHITRSVYLHNLLKATCQSYHADARLALEQSSPLALSMSGLTAVPVFL